MNPAIINTAITSVTAKETNGLVKNRYGKINKITVPMYANHVYNEAVMGLFSPSALLDKYSDAPIENDAAIPVTRPDNAINSIFCNANVKPASTPVSSTKASLSHSTIDHTYSSLFSLSRATNFASCFPSSSIIFSSPTT